VIDDVVVHEAGRVNELERGRERKKGWVVVAPRARAIVAMRSGRTRLPPVEHAYRAASLS